MDDATISLLILAAVIVVFVVNRLPIGVVAVLTTLALWATGVVDTEAALITLNGSVAALLPLAVALALRIHTSPGLMMMPLAFAGSAGSLLALTGSPVNVIVSEAARDAGAGGFGFFRFAAVWVPILLGTLAIAIVVCPRVLPAIRPVDQTPDLSKHAQVLEHHYELTHGFYRLRVRELSPLVGADAAGLRLDDYPGLRLLGVQAGYAVDPHPPGRLAPDDVLVVTGPASEVSHLVIDRGLAARLKPVTDAQDLLGREVGVAKVIVPPRSPLVGERVYPGMARGPKS